MKIVEEISLDDKIKYLSTEQQLYVRGIIDGILLHYDKLELERS